MRFVCRSAALWLLLAMIQGSAFSQSSWPQWGGPRRDFKSDVKGIPDMWPATGPRRIWNRQLGDGYSAIVAEGDRLFTMYRRGLQDVVICLDANTGQTVWEFAYDAPFSREYVLEQGEGPRATPLVSGGRVFSSGPTGKMHCLEARTGKPLWSHDLITEFKGTVRVRGYSCSPLAYKNTVIMMVGGAGNSVIAFDQKTGAVAWKKGDYQNSPSSPIIINVDGQDQLVAFMYGEIVGLDPASGDTLWSHPHQTDYGLNISTPVWGEGNLLFCSSAYGGGSRVIKLARAGGQTRVEEVWFHRLMRIHFSNAIRAGDFIYGSSGDFGPTPFVAVNVKTGQVAWRDRGLSKASFIYADGKFIAIDEDGHLILASPSDQGLKIHSKVELLTSNAWTAPTLVGTRLYVRDRRAIMALDLK